jgi:hypothetical protein
MNWKFLAIVATVLSVLSGCSVAPVADPHVAGVKPMLQQEIDEFNRNLDNDDDRYDRPARLLKGYLPIYPVSRLFTGTQGVCRVAFTIGANGRALRPKPDAEADRKMCDHALYALNHWEFEPATLRGEPVEFAIRIPFTYALK